MNSTIEDKVNFHSSHIYLLKIKKIYEEQLVAGIVNRNYTSPDCGLSPNCTVQRNGNVNTKLTCQFNYPGAIGQVHK